MDEFAIAVRQFLLVCGAVITIGGAWKVYKEIKKPNDDLKETVRRHEEWLKRDNDRIKSIESLVITQEGIKKELNEHSRRLGEHEERLEEDKQRGNLTLKANIAIINNMLSENDKDKLQETRDEIQNFLLDKN
ncbi:hypothetical protein ACTQXP_03920 [Holdemanella porci]|uniref:hypothetical protein n=1 Tax=Holdemanella porci TaxID=2652276 RepID=UPI003F8DEABC